MLDRGAPSQDGDFGSDFERITSGVLISSAAARERSTVAAGASYATFNPGPMVFQCRCSCHCERRQMLRETEKCHKASQ